MPWPWHIFFLLRTHHSTHLRISPYIFCGKNIYSKSVEFSEEYWKNCFHWNCTQSRTIYFVNHIIYACHTQTQTGSVERTENHLLRTHFNRFSYTLWHDIPHVLKIIIKSVRVINLMYRKMEWDRYFPYYSAVWPAHSECENKVDACIRRALKFAGWLMADGVHAVLSLTFHASDRSGAGRNKKPIIKSWKFYFKFEIEYFMK